MKSINTNNLLPSILWKLIIVSIVITLGGCAAEVAYKKGIQLSESGDKEGALQNFTKAIQIDNGSALYRMAAIQAQVELMQIHRQKFQQLLNEERIEDAQALLNLYLLNATDAHKLRDRLQAKQMGQRHATQLQRAQQQIKSGAKEQALITLRNILSENPQHTQAAGLLSSLEETSTRLAGLNNAYKTPISIVFKDAPLKSVFDVISLTSGINILFDKEVRTDQKTSILLRNSTVEAAIRLTLLTNQLSFRVLDGNSILIYPNNQAKQKDYQELTVKTFYLSNVEAKTVAATIKTILKTRDIVIDDKLNMIILRDSPENIRLAEKLVAVHDVVNPEVMLEVEILEVNRSRLLNLGVRWPDQLSLSPLTVGTANLTLADLWAVTRDRRGVTVGASISGMDIHAGKTDSEGDILANPRIRVRNREKARILIGDRVPNITATSTSSGFVAESVNYVDVGLKLEVEPVISIDGDVTMKISLEVSNIVDQTTTKAGSVAYRIGTRSANTVLQLRDGENQVLAGLINSEERGSANKVPGLGEIPLVNRLFGHQIDTNKRSEIVLSITPRILRNITRPNINLLEFESGTESIPGSTFKTENLGAAATTSQNQPRSDNVPAVQSGQVGSVAAPIQPATQLTDAKTTGRLSEQNNSSSPTAYSVNWLAPIQATSGNTFTVQLKMQTDAPLISVPLSIAFTPGTLQVVSVQEGDLLRADGSQSSFAHRVDPNGQILITSTRADDPRISRDSPQGTSGTLASIVLRALKPTTGSTAATLQVVSIAPIGIGGAPMTAPLPKPHTIDIVP